MAARWEEPASALQSAHHSQHQSLPSLSDLAQGVPATGRPDDSQYFPRNEIIRDSGNWSMQSQSKHSSTASFAASALQLPALTTTRSPPSEHMIGVTSERPHYSSGFSQGPIAEGVEPRGSQLPQINQSFEPSHHAGIADVPAPPEGRPPSVSSRLDHLALMSPVPSGNVSQVSLASGLQRERYGGSHSGTTSLGRRVAGRTAPVIGVNAPWQNPNADQPTKGLPWAFPDPEPVPNPNAMKPTKGMPWAFPDPELAGRPSSKSEHERTGHSASLRRESIGGASVASSIYTTDSRLPPGQQRLDDDSSPNEATMLHDQGINQHHHHHQLQHRQLSTLSSEPASPAGNTPYSRTPELRVSHKLAERKRRSEMKNLFEELRLILPTDGRVSKSSKWEILTKAIDYIRSLEQGQTTSERKAEAYRGEAERAVGLQRENQEMRDEIQRLRQQLQQNMSLPNGNVHYHHGSSGPSAASNPRPGLPIPASASAMQGVQFSN